MSGARPSADTIRARDEVSSSRCAMKKRAESLEKSSITYRGFACFQSERR
jgi:hypothetical protein